MRPKSETDVLKKSGKLYQNLFKEKTHTSGKDNCYKIISHIEMCSYIYLALSNHPAMMVKRLNNLFYKFLWNSGPDGIKRKFPQERP